MRALDLPTLLYPGELVLKPLAPLPDVNHPAALDAYGLAPVIDGHNDLAWTARQIAGYSVENLEKDSIFQTDIDKLGRGGGVRSSGRCSHRAT